MFFVVPLRHGAARWFGFTLGISSNPTVMFKVSYIFFGDISSEIIQYVLSVP